MLLAAVVAASILVIVSAQTGLCPAANGDFANPSSEACTTFFRCIQNNPTLLRCPANQRFDFLFRLCRPQGQVDCNSQLQVFAAPVVVPGLAGVGGAGNVGGLTGLGGAGGLAGLGNVLGGGLGAGLPNGGLITLLSQLDGSGQDGQGLATALTLSALMNQMNTANQAPVNQYPVTPILPSAAFNPPTVQRQPANPSTLGVANTVPTVRTANGKTIIVIPQQYPQNQILAQPGQVQGQGNGVYWSSGTGQVPNVQQGQTALQGQTNRAYWNGNSATGQGVNAPPQGQNIVQGQPNKVYWNGNSGAGQGVNLPQQGQTAVQGQIRQGQIRQGQSGQSQGQFSSILKKLRSGNGGGSAVIRDESDSDNKS